VGKGVARSKARSRPYPAEDARDRADGPPTVNVLALVTASVPASVALPVTLDVPVTLEYRVPIAEQHGLAVRAVVTNGAGNSRNQRAGRNRGPARWPIDRLAPEAINIERWRRACDGTKVSTRLSRCAKLSNPESVVSV
jgi:hypothetical protein